MKTNAILPSTCVKPVVCHAPLVKRGNHNINVSKHPNEREVCVYIKENYNCTIKLRPQQRVLFNQIRTISTTCMFKQSRRHCYVVVDVGVIVLFVFAASFFCFLLSLLVWSICCRSNLLFLRRPFSSSRTSLRSFRSN